MPVFNAEFLDHMIMAAYEATRAVPVVDHDLRTDLFFALLSCPELSADSFFPAPNAF